MRMQDPNNRSAEVPLVYAINGIITRRGIRQAIVAMQANFEGRIK